MPYELHVLDRLDRYIFSVFKAIKSKKDWRDKIFKYESKWREEILAQKIIEMPYTLSSSEEDEIINSSFFTPINVPKTLDYVFKYLKCEALSMPLGIELAWIRNVYYADNLIPQYLKQHLIDLDIKETPHPGSKNTFNLVHPSMYCGVTTDDSDKPALSSLYWLPTPFHVKRLPDQPPKVTALSYINNIHPRRKKTYHVIEQIIGCVLPLFEMMLAFDHDIDHDNSANYERCIYCYGKGQVNGELCECRIECASCMQPIPCENKCNKWNPPKELKVPEFRGFKKSACKQLKKVKIIVKIAVIRLTPEDPIYTGGSWHIEGIPEEKIIGSAIYYYSQENISASELTFREHLPEDAPIDYEQHEHTHVSEKYGIEREWVANQYLGSVPTIQDRVLVFPNVYQHQVQSFRLVDAKRPGYRKILALFLVDPGAKDVPDTSTFDIQRHDWVRPLLVRHVPDVLADIILEYFSDGTFENAKVNMEKMIKMRSIHAEKSNEEYEEMYSLCEH